MMDTAYREVRRTLHAQAIRRWVETGVGAVLLLALLLLLAGCYIGAGSPTTIGWNADGSKPVVPISTEYSPTLTGGSPVTTEYVFPVY